MNPKADPALVQRMQRLPHCDSCPTLKGAQDGWDPEMEALLGDLKLLEDYGKDVHCPWKQQPCVCYRVLYFDTRKKLTESQP